MIPYSQVDDKLTESLIKLNGSYFQTRVAGGSIKPGVKRSGTPGPGQIGKPSARSVRQHKIRTIYWAAAHFVGFA